MDILFVLTSHDKLGDTGNKTGFWIEEFASPYYTLLDNGANITLASPEGGRPPIDPSSDTPDAQTEATERFKDDQDLQHKMDNTKKLSEVNEDDFEAVFYPGGHGPLWDLSQDKDSISLIEAFNESGKPLGFVCHAPAALKNVKGTDGNPLVKNKKVAGFSNTEEEGVGLTDVVPFRVEDMLVDNGGSYSKADDWQPHVVADGNLVTGQNLASSKGVAEKLLAMLN